MKRKDYYQQSIGAQVSSMTQKRGRRLLYEQGIICFACPLCDNTALGNIINSITN